jgi:hypothetical protein
MLKNLATAFGVLGIPCVVGDLPNDEEIDGHGRAGVDVFFEINRLKLPAHGARGDLIHVSFIDDLNAAEPFPERLDEAVMTSDLTYFGFPPEIWYGSLKFAGERGILVPGYEPIPGQRPKYAPMDISFMGHIATTLKPGLVADFRGRGGIDMLALYFLFRHVGLSQSNYRYDRVKALTEDFIRWCLNVPDVDLTYRELTTLVLRYFRGYDRADMLMSFLRASASFGIFTDPEASRWELWPPLGNHVRGYARTPAEVYGVFDASAINVHYSGWTMHFRSIDCLAAGRLLFVNNTDNDLGEADIRTHFKPGEHYVGYDRDNAADLARWYLKRPELGEAMGAKARERALTHHSWRERAKQIVDDVARL